MKGYIKHFVNGRRKSIKRYTSKEQREAIIKDYKGVGLYEILPDEIDFTRPEAVYTNKNHWESNPPNEPKKR